MKKEKPAKRTKRNANACQETGASRRLEIVGDIESPIEDWKHWDPAKNLEE
jgi:hypothetical protein